jgi:hypothetical protein
MSRCRREGQQALVRQRKMRSQCRWRRAPTWARGRDEDVVVVATGTHASTATNTSRCRHEGSSQVWQRGGRDTDPRAPPWVPGRDEHVDVAATRTNASTATHDEVPTPAAPCTQRNEHVALSPRRHHATPPNLRAGYTR